jgi:PAS domain S-box-containing protein
MLLIGFLGMYVFYKNPQSTVNRKFFWFTMSIAAWDFVDYNFKLAPSYLFAYIWSIGFAVIPFVITTTYQFALSLTEVKNYYEKNFWNYWAYIGLIIVIAVNLVNLISFPVFEHNGASWDMVFGTNIASFLGDFTLIIWGLPVFIYAFYVGWKHYRKTLDPIRRKQLLFIMWTAIFSLALDLFESLSWFTGLPVPSFSYYSLTILAIGIAFAMVRYDMFALNASTAAESIISTMKDAVMLLTPDKRISLVNGGFEKVSGFTQADVVGKQVQNIVDANIEKAEGKELDASLFAKTATIPVSLVASRFVSSSGMLRGIVVIMRDIRERKAQELMLAQSYEDIKAADTQIRIEVAKLHTILESVGEGLLVVDEKGSIAMINQAGEELLRRKESALVGKEFYQEFPLVDEKGVHVNISDKVSLLSRSNDTVRFNIADSLYLQADKSKRFPIGMSISRVPFDKTNYGLVVVFDNVTKEMEIDKAKSEFVSLAAHQLRVPITAMKWNLEMVSDELREKKEEEMLGLVTIAYDQADNMADLVEQFLNVSRIELGKLSVTPVMINLAVLMRDVIADQQVNAQEKKQELVVDLDAKIQEIPLDKTLLRVVVQNLLSNAIKYTPEKGKVMVTLTAEKTYAKMVFKDTGIGIPKHQQKELFGKLFRADNAVSSGQEGNGLGLYLVKEVVQIADGNISFESEVGKGTTFTVVIPYKGMAERKGSRTLSEKVS